mgnify:CR=1 FL=1
MQHRRLPAPLGVPTQLNQTALSLDSAPLHWKEWDSPYNEKQDDRIRILDDANR